MKIVDVTDVELIVVPSMKDAQLEGVKFYGVHADGRTFRIKDEIIQNVFQPRLVRVTPAAYNFTIQPITMPFRIIVKDDTFRVVFLFDGKLGDLTTADIVPVKEPLSLTFVIHGKTGDGELCETRIEAPLDMTEKLYQMIK